MRTIIYIAALLSFTSASSLHAELGVVAGNSAGESTPAKQSDDDGGGGGGTGAFNLPPSPSITKVQRLDKNTVKITFGHWGPSMPGDFLTLMRTQDDGPWETHFQAFGGMGDDTWKDESAPADHDYRYVAFASGNRIARGLRAIAQQVDSAPTEDKRITDVATNIHASFYNFDANPPPVPAIDVKLDKFIPDDYSAAAHGDSPPDSPYEYTGPLNLYQGGHSDTIKLGYLPRSIDLHGSGTLRGSTYYYITLEVVTGLRYRSLPGGTTTYPNGSTLHTINDSIMRIYGAFIHSDEAKGFDARSNPTWQMLPTDGSSTLRINTEVAATLDRDGLTVIPDQVPVGNDTLVTVSPVGLTGEKTIEVPGLRAKVKLDLRARHNLTVAVYPLYRVKVDVQHPNGVRIDKITLPKKADLEAELHAIYGERANVWFTATIAPQELEFLPTDDFDGDGRCSIISSEANKFSAIADGNGYDYSLFIFATGGWGDASGVGHGGQAVSIKGKFAFADSANANLLSHELGHCMGLSHAFQEGTGYSSSDIPDDSNTRIMGYGYTGRRLIKLERDEIFKKLEPTP